VAEVGFWPRRSAKAAAPVRISEDHDVDRIEQKRRGLAVAAILPQEQ